MLSVWKLSVLGFLKDKDQQTLGTIHRGFPLSFLFGYFAHVCTHTFTIHKGTVA